jgi:hypothetical protein
MKCMRLFSYKSRPFDPPRPLSLTNTPQTGQYHFYTDRSRYSADIRPYPKTPD